MMLLQVSKWGNSLAVRLPASYAKQSGIHSGDYLEATLAPGGELRLVPNSVSGDKTSFLKSLSALHAGLPQTTSVMDALREEARY